MSTLCCPQCSRPLQSTDVEGEQVLACPERHGLWLDHIQLERLAEDDDDDAPPEDEDAAWRASDPEPEGLVTERFRNCPVCGRTLAKDNWKFGSGVVVDSCREHGVWVEDGELQRIEAWSEAWERYRPG